MIMRNHDRDEKNAIKWQREYWYYTIITESGEKVLIEMQEDTEIRRVNLKGSKR